MRSLQTLFRIGAAAAVICMALTSHAQITFEKLFTGEGMKPLASAELTSSYHAYRFGGPQTSDPSNMFTNPMMMMFGVMGSLTQSMSPGAGAAEGDSVNPMALFSMIGVYWTKGDIIDIENSEFLIGYTVNLNMEAMNSSGPPPTVGDAISLDPMLVRLSTVQSISPLNNLTADKFKAMLSKKIQDSSSSGSAASVAVPSPAEPPELSIGSVPVVGVEAPPMSMLPEEDRENRTKCMSNAKQIALAMIMYSADYDDHFPSAQSTGKVKEQIRPYMKNDQLWNTFNPGSEFRYNVRLSVMSASQVENPAQTPLLYESKPWADGRRTMAFTDGHVTLISEEQWQRLVAKYKLKT